MHIGIDARFFGPIGKGLGRYTQKLLQNLELIDTQNQYSVFLKQENWDEYSPRSENFKKVLAPFNWYTVQEQIEMPRVIKKEKVDLMHFPHFNIPFFYRGKFVVTIHDLILLRFPTKKATTLGPIKYKIKELGYLAVINKAITKSEKIIAVSDFTKKDIVDYFRINEKKVVVTYEGVDMPRIGENTARVLESYIITKPYLLYVGNVYPHKNIESLLLAMKKLSSSSLLKLVIVCKKDYFLERAINYSYRIGVADKVVFAGYVPDRDLNAIYENAEAYVFPSFYEGFGLPPLEAMAHGLPVLSSNATSMPEILKDAAIYFNPNVPDEIVNLIQKITGDNTLKLQLVEKGLRLVEQYKWSDMVKKTLDVYKSCVTSS